MENKKSRRNPKVWFGIIFGAAIAISAQFFISKNPGIESTMKAAAAEINKSCPSMLDEQTRFDNVEVKDGKVFQYNYTLVNLTAADIDLEAAKKELEVNLVNSVKNDAELKIYRDNNTSLKYNYKDKDGKFLFLISVTPDKYNN